MFPCVKGSAADNGNYENQKPGSFGEPDTNVGEINSDAILNQPIIKYRRVKVY